MTDNRPIIYPNMGKDFCDNPPFVEKCMYCGAVAEMGGVTWWEWWQHMICCSRHCKESPKMESKGRTMADIIKEWNDYNKQPKSKPQKRLRCELGGFCRKSACSKSWYCCDFLIEESNTSQKETTNPKG